MFNERSKLRWEQYKRKEENYKELLRCLDGFYVAAHNIDLKSQFLYQVKLLWLYAPDEVIRLAYKFLNTVKADASASEQDKHLALGTFVRAVRKDLLDRNVVKESNLTADDFQHLTA